MAMAMAMAMVTAPVIMNKIRPLSARMFYGHRLRRSEPMFETAMRGYEAPSWLAYTKVG
jgi:hypothetical protein